MIGDLLAHIEWEVIPIDKSRNNGLIPKYETKWLPFYSGFGLLVSRRLGLAILLRLPRRSRRGVSCE
jgi:hypothetical protein